MEAHGHKDPTAEGDGHGEGFLAGPSDERNEAGQNGMKASNPSPTATSLATSAPRWATW